MTRHDHVARALAAWRSRHSLLTRAREWWEQNPERGRRLALAAFEELHPTLLETVMKDLELAPRMERRGVYVSERPVMDAVRAAQVAGNHTRAAKLAMAAFEGLPNNLLQEILEDLRAAPVMGRPGLRVRARRPCPFCEGTGVSPVPLGRSPLTPRTLPPDDDWGDCPTCWGEGVVRLPLDQDTEEVLRAMTPEGTADISWDWPPELYSGDLAQEFGLLDEGYDGREAR
jgi:hypothetical protein